MKRMTRIIPALKMTSLDTEDMTAMKMKKRTRRMKARNIWFPDHHHQMMTKMPYLNKGSDKKSCKRMHSNISLRNRYRHSLTKLRISKKSNSINIRSRE